MVFASEEDDADSSEMLRRGGDNVPSVRVSGWMDSGWLASFCWFLTPVRGSCSQIGTMHESKDTLSHISHSHHAYTRLSTSTHPFHLTGCRQHGRQERDADKGRAGGHSALWNGRPLCGARWVWVCGVCVPVALDGIAIVTVVGLQMLFLRLALPVAHVILV